MAKKMSLEKKKQLKEENLQRKAERVKEENKILGNCIGFLAVLTIAEIYFLLCYRFFAEGMIQNITIWANAIGTLSWAGLVVLIVGAVLGLAKRGQKMGHMGAWIALLGALFFVGGRMMLDVYPGGTMMMCVVTPLIGLAGFVFYLYQREFFCTGMGMGLALFGTWFAHHSVGSATWESRYMIVEGILLVAVLAILAFTVIVGRNGGKLGKGEKERPCFSGTTKYAFAYGALVLAALAIAVAMAAPAMGLYLMWAGMALLFVLAVYYTVKMM